MSRPWIILWSLAVALPAGALAASPSASSSTSAAAVTRDQDFTRSRVRIFPELFELSGNVTLDPATNRPQLVIQARNVSDGGAFFHYHYPLFVYEVEIRREDGSRVDLEALCPAAGSGSVRTQGAGETHTSVLPLDCLFHLSDPASYAVTIRFQENLIDLSSDFAARKNSLRLPKNRGMCQFTWKPKSMARLPIIPGLDATEAARRFGN